MNMKMAKRSVAENKAGTLEERACALAAFVSTDLPTRTREKTCTNRGKISMANQFPPQSLSPLSHIHKPSYPTTPPPPSSRTGSHEVEPREAPDDADGPKHSRNSEHTQRPHPEALQDRRAGGSEGARERGREESFERESAEMKSFTSTDWNAAG